MFEAIKYQWKLRKLDKECSTIKGTYDAHRKGLVNRFDSAINEG